MKDSKRSEVVVMKHIKAITLFLVSVLTIGILVSCEIKDDVSDNKNDLTNKEQYETDIVVERESDIDVNKTYECTSDVIEETTNDKSSETNTNVEIETFVSPQTLTFYNIYDYNDYIENNKMFDGFIYYEMIEFIGDFDSLIFNDKDDEDNYYYGLRLNNGADINLWVHHMPEEANGEYVPPVKSEVIKLDTPLDDFLICDVGETDDLYKYVYYNNIVYKYAEDSLLSIIFIVDGIQYEFSPGYKLDFSDYKTDDDNILTCLLSGNSDNIDLTSFFKASPNN